MTKPPEVSIVVPTYREAENLPVLIPLIAETLDKAAKPFEIIVVDDDSQDGTQEICADLAQILPLRLITRTSERGLATAVLHGLDEARGQVLVVMDADLSHPPDAIPALVDRCLDPSVDFVIGSRYIQGGAVDDSWNLWRRINSRVATALARGLTSARDPMAGFFALKRETFRSADDLEPLGYKIGLELIVRCNCREVAEVPIHFHDRTCGVSKLGMDQQWLYLRHLARLYGHKFPTTSRAVRFGLVGLTGMAVDLTTLALLMTTAPFAVARLVSIAAAMTWNFALHRSFTFPTQRGDSIGRQYVAFCGACLLGAAVNWNVSMMVTTVAGSLWGHALVASAVGVVAGAFTNFWLADRAVFRQVQTAETQLVDELPQTIPFRAKVEPNAGYHGRQWRKSA